MAPVRILVVEDENIVAKDIQHSLKSLGYAVPAVVASGEEAIDKAAETHPDLVLMDILLKGDMDGVAAAGQIRARLDIPVVFLTAYADDHTLHRAKISEPYGYILKPFEERDLHTTIEMALYKHKMERKLRESEDRYRDLVENSQDLICTHDLDGFVLSVNHGAAKALGYDPREILNKNLRDAIVPEFRDKVDAYLDQIRKDGFANGVMRVLTASGEMRIWEYRNTLRTEGVATPIVRGLAHDITERNRAEKALRLSEERYRTLIEQMPDGVYRSTPEGKFIEVNPAMVKMLGYESKEELMAVDIKTQLYFDPKERESMVESLRQAGNQNIDVFRLRRKDGRELWVEDHGRLVCSAEGNVLYHEGILRDITERRQAEQERQQAEAQLRHVQKMETIGTLAGGIAHDFNNQLTGIIGNLEMALLDLGADNPVNAILQDAQKAATRCVEMTKSLLAFGRKLEGQPQSINLNEVVWETHRLLKRALPATIQIELQVDAGLWTVNADPTQMQQVLMNLCVNARDAILDTKPDCARLETHKVGAIIIQTRNQIVDEQACRHNIDARSGRFIVLSVADTGCGIPPENLGRIFEPFFTTKEIGRGIGLGLSMVFGIIKAHHGWIEVKSPARIPTPDIQSGPIATTFEIFLPAIESVEMTPAAQRQTSSPSLGGNETILIVDDEQIVRQTARLLLSRHGYRVFTAESGDMALDLYRKSWHEIDLVLLDLTMPKMSGKQVFQEMRVINPWARVVICTGYAVEGEASDVLALGAAAFLQKPFVVGGLLQIVREVLGRDGE